MKNKLMNDLKEAMKEKDVIKKNTIQLIRALILQEEKDKQIELNDNQIQDIIAKEKKKRNESLKQFEKAQRNDLIEQTKREIEILENYLPEQLSEGEIETIIIGIIDRTGIHEFGPIMKQAKAEIGNSADGKIISKVIKEILSK